MPICFLSMANPIATSNQGNKLLVFHVLGLFTLFLLMQKGGAFQFQVGGSMGWTLPSSDPNALHYNQWAEKNRFQIGDSLLFVYPADKDSVLQVKMEDYTNCNTDTYLGKFSDGHSEFTFNQSGPHYFISGVKENCLKNEKMVVVVLAERSNDNNSSLSPPPSPAPAGEESPPPPPPPPPPSGAGEIVPSSPPTSEQSPPPPPSGASSIFMSLIGSFGAFIGSSCLLLVF